MRIRNAALGAKKAGLWYGLSPWWLYIGLFIGIFIVMADGNTVVNTLIVLGVIGACDIYLTFKLEKNLAEFLSIVKRFVTGRFKYPLKF